MFRQNTPELEKEINRLMQDQEAVTALLNSLPDMAAANDKTLFSLLDASFPNLELKLDQASSMLIAIELANKNIFNNPDSNFSLSEENQLLIDRGNAVIAR